MIFVLCVMEGCAVVLFFFSSRRRHTISLRDWSSDVCSSDLFASRYGLQSEYWHHFKPEELPEVLAYLKTNLKDLATHYHAEYQSAENADEKLANYREALRWYGDYLKSFPKDADSPAINYELADLLLENKDFGEAARQYQRTAYEYPF